MLQCVVVCCSVLQSAVQCAPGVHEPKVRCSPSVYTCCSVLQCVLQCTPSVYKDCISSKTREDFILIDCIHSSVFVVVCSVIVVLLFSCISSKTQVVCSVLVELLLLQLK